MPAKYKRQQYLSVRMNLIWIKKKKTVLPYLHVIRLFIFFSTPHVSPRCTSNEMYLLHGGVSPRIEISYLRKNPFRGIVLPVYNSHALTRFSFPFPRWKRGDAQTVRIYSIKRNVYKPCDLAKKSFETKRRCNCNTRWSHESWRLNFPCDRKYFVHLTDGLSRRIIYLYTKIKK